MNARLKVLHDKANVKQVKLLPTTVVGRSTECDLKIASSQVSRVHCRITVRDDAVYVEDLGSANGTFVNDQMLNPRQPTAVQPGAKITIGPAEFLVDYIAPTSSTVVIRRSDPAAKPTGEDLRNDAESANKDLIFAAATVPEEESEATLVGERMEELVAAVREVASPKVLSNQEIEIAAPKVVADFPAQTVNPAPVPQAVAKAAIPTVAPAVQQPVVARVESIEIKAPVIAVGPVEKSGILVVSDSSGARAPSPAFSPVAVKPAIAMPVTPPVAKAVAVAAPVVAAVPPTARAVPMTAQPVAVPKRAEPVQAPPPNPFQFGEPQPTPKPAPVVEQNVLQPPAKVAVPVAAVPVAAVPVVAAAVVAAPVAAPVASPVAVAPPIAVVPPTPVAPAAIAPQPFAPIAEAPAPAPVADEGFGFNFGETAYTETEEPTRAAKPAAKAGKAGGLKSLLSVFGRKAESKAKASAPPAEAVEEHAEPVAEAPSETSSEPQLFAFGGGESASEAGTESSDDSPPDDFQDFLKQF